MEVILLFEIEPRYKKDDRNDGRYVGLIHVLGLQTGRLNVLGMND